MKLKRRSNGYFYIYFDRDNSRSLGTKDKELAGQLFRQRKATQKAGELEQLNKVKNIRLGEFTAEYLAIRWELVLMAELAGSTYRNDSIALRSLLDALGDVQLQNVEHRVKLFKTRLLAGAEDLEKRKNTINSYLGSLSSAFSWAAAPDPETGRPAYISSNPFAESRTRSVKFRGIKRLPKYITIEEVGRLQAQFASEIKDLERRRTFARGLELYNIKKGLLSRSEMAPMLSFYLYTGLRVSELARLSWEDVRLQEGIIYVRQAKDREERVVPIPPALEEVIVAMGVKDLGRVFRWTPGHVSKQFKRLARAAGLDESKTLKGLRHSYGTLAADAGMALDVIQSNMGHSSVKTTEIYKDVLVRRQRAEASKLDFRQALSA